MEVVVVDDVIVGPSSFVTPRLAEPYDVDHRLLLFLDPDTDSYLLWIENGTRKLTQDFPSRRNVRPVLEVLSRLIPDPRVFREAEAFVIRHSLRAA